MQCVWPPQPSHMSAHGVVLTPSEIWSHCWWQMTPGPSQAMVHTDSSHLLSPSGPAVSTGGPLSAFSAGDGLWPGQSHWALWWSCFELTLASQRPRKKGRHTVSHLQSRRADSTPFLYFIPASAQAWAPHYKPSSVISESLLPFKIFTHHPLHARNGNWGKAVLHAAW